MEADWEVEIGGDAPILDAAWPGFVDLRMRFEAIGELPEVAAFPPLGDALERLNAGSSPVWTAKTDFWPLTSIDPYEFDMSEDDDAIGYACYVDVLAADAHGWSSVDQVAAWCRLQCTNLHPIALRACRVDFVMRAAVLPGGHAGLGVTVYVSAAGPDNEDALRRLAEALGVCADTISSVGHSEGGSTLQ